MAVNKVEYGGETLIDLTGDSVAPETLAEGETAHNAAGEKITGTMKSVPVGGSSDIVFDNGYGIKGYYEDGEYFTIYRRGDGDVLINPISPISGHERNYSYTHIYGEEILMHSNIIAYGMELDISDVYAIGDIVAGGDLRLEGNLTDGTNSVTIEELGNMRNNTIDKIYWLDLGYGDNEYTSADGDGVYWRQTAIMENTEQEEVCSFTVANRIPIVAGTNVTFEKDETNQTIKINASGGGITFDQIHELRLNESAPNPIVANYSGIHWECDGYVENDDTDTSFTVLHTVPIAAGENITIAVDPNDEERVLISATGGVPSCTTADKGKFLRVNSSGEAYWATVPKAEGNLF